MKTTYITKYWLPVFVWIGVIFFFSSLPSIPGGEKNILDFIVKKSAHVTEYAIFYGLLYSALSAQKTNSKLSPPAKGEKNVVQRGFTPFHLSFLLGLFYAFTDESHQLFIPGRTGLIRDIFFFDLTGLLLAWAILNHHYQKRK